MLFVPTIADGGFVRRINPGDVVGGMEPAIPATDTTNTTFSYTAAIMLGSYTYVRNPAGVSTDTYPTADAFIQALIGSGQALAVGTSFRFRVINLSANLLTGAVTANTGATMVRGNVLASTTKDFLIQFTNVSPARTVGGITSVSGSAITTGWLLADLSALSVGMVVTNAIVNLQGQTIIGINMAAGSVTFSGNANASQSGNTITLSGAYTITGLSA